jgi:hypothetical protein
MVHFGVATVINKKIRSGSRKSKPHPASSARADPERLLTWVNGWAFIVQQGKTGALPW